LPVAVPPPSTLVTDALKKKGLRLQVVLGGQGARAGDRCPEEEGIKTVVLASYCPQLPLVTDALKKKGLRR